MGALAIVAISSIAVAQNVPAPGSLSVYRDWIVGCDNIVSCHATSLAPEDIADNKSRKAAGGALISVKRDPAERSAAIVGISLISGLEDGPNVTVTMLKVDDIVLDVPFRYEKGVISLPPGTNDILIQRLLKGNILYLLDEKGETITSASLAGLSAALRHIDARQNRIGTQSATIAKGNKAFNGPAIVPAYPVVGVPDPTKTAPAQMTASDAERARGFHKCRSTDQVVPIKYARLDKANTVAIIHALCGTGAYNSTVRIAIIDNEGRIRTPEFETSGSREKPDQFINGWWDESKGLLGSYAKSRGIGDCGLVERYAWDGRQFRFAERMEMTECRGSIDYITTWRANTLRQGSGGKTVEAPVTPPEKTEPVVLSETDTIMLEQAEKACKREDFKSFFEAALRSKPVRLAYFTSPIATATGMQRVDRYNFPIQMLDYNYVTSETAGMASGEREYVQLEFNQAQDEQYRIDWVRVDFGKNGNDEGETPEDDKTYGPQGYLIFKPTTECWTLVEDGETNISRFDHFVVSDWRNG